MARCHSSLSPETIIAINTLLADGLSMPQVALEEYDSFMADFRAKFARFMTARVAGEQYDEAAASVSAMLLQGTPAGPNVGDGDEG